MYKNNKGITLIALVITIIVMLILVAVTISMAVNGGLFNYAGKAVGETQNALNVEQELSNGRINVGGVWYDSIDDYLKGEPAVLSYANAEKDANGMLTANATYTDKNKDTAVIPKGFAISNKSDEQTIENGLVIKDENDNEFVWIPVEKAIVTEAEITAIKAEDTSITTDLAAVQKMVNGGTYPMAVQVGEDYKGILYDFSGTDTLTATVEDWTSTSGNREPANLTASKTWSSETTVNGTTVAAGTSYVYDSQDMFTLYGLGTYTDTLYQESFDKMVKSVALNGGFYVGRYEISSGTYTLEDGSTVTYAQSKSNQTALVSTAWYNMYKYERDYAAYNSNLGVTSEMIWGAQWDQMMIFVNGKDDGAETPALFYVTTKGSRNSGTSSSTKTGMNAVDQVANIFDLEASRYEWTQEADSTNLRVNRGGRYYGSGSKASNRGGSNPTNSVSSYDSSRASLYIK